MRTVGADERDEKILAQVAAYFVRRCRWADRNDLLQEGRLALETARRRFDPAKGAWEGYAATAADQAMRRFCWRFSAPVSGGLHRPAERPKLQSTPFDAREHGLGYEDSPEAAYLARAAEHAAWDRMTALSEALDLDAVAAWAARLVLMGEAEPREAARAFPGRYVAVRKVYDAASKLRRAAREDQALHDLVRGGAIG